MSTNTAFDKWADTYARWNHTGEALLWPSETLVRLFKGNYIPNLDRSSYAGKSVLDIGHGAGNNLIFLGSLGMKLHGTEVDGSICRDVTARLARLGYDADLRPGTNRQIPFEDGTFDFLVSWNVLHYEPTEENITQALAEYRRVLKPGGWLFVSTTGPEHKILTGATTLGGHRYRIGRSDDFRKGEVYFYFDSPGYIHHYFDPHFEQVAVGRTHDQLMTETLDWFIVSGRRGAA